MRITRNRLQDMINEEISRQLLDSQNSALLESYGGQGDESLKYMDAAGLIVFAKAYASLGRSAQEQLDDLIAGNYEISDAASEAAALIQVHLGGMNEEIDLATQDYIDASIESRKDY